jgi:hypothetical protein
MRIIDKNTDYYDYLQNSDDSIVFDRRGSYILTKEKFCDKLETKYGQKYQHNCMIRELRDEHLYRYVTLQCGATIWLILVHITDCDKWLRPTDYEMELLTTWKNYDTQRNVLKLCEIEFWYYTLVEQKKTQTYHDLIISNVDRMVQAINTGDLHDINVMNREIVSRFNKQTLVKEERTIPILTACGISDIIDPIDIFTALEEHFSLCKTESERIDPIGATNDDKITMHGFDTKTSFRGKQKGTAV